MTTDTDPHDFAAIAALTIHDVKNSLAQLAAEAESRGDFKSRQIALEASVTLSGLLCYYKSESHNLHVQIEPHAPADLIADLIATLPVGFSENSQITLTTNLSAAPDLWFYDQTLIQMVLANALHNALRFARNQITITVTTRAEQLIFQIHDDGSGYPPTMIENIVGHQPVTRHGTGLGLRLAQRVVALHQHHGKFGSLHLSNLPGAQFELRLP